jgi:hypothetical protein
MQHLEDRKQVYLTKTMVACKAEFIELRDRFAQITPRDTGAAAGIEGDRPLYNSHPASKMGLTIGNEEGQSGWQVVFTQGRGSNAKYALKNPMWKPYLQFLEYGVVPGSYIQGTFRAEWKAHLTKAAEKRKTTFKV